MDWQPLLNVLAGGVAGALGGGGVVKVWIDYRHADRQKRLDLAASERTAQMASDDAEIAALRSERTMLFNKILTLTEQVAELKVTHIKESATLKIEHIRDLQQQESINRTLQEQIEERFAEIVTLDKRAQECEASHAALTEELERLRRPGK